MDKEIEGQDLANFIMRYFQNDENKLDVCVDDIEHIIWNDILVEEL